MNSAPHRPRATPKKSQDPDDLDDENDPLTSPKAKANRLIPLLRKDYQFMLDKTQDLWVFESGHLVKADHLWVQNWVGARYTEPLSAYLIGLVHQNLKTGLKTMPDRPPSGKINLLNGLLDVRTGKLEVATVENWPSPIQIPIIYDPTAICPEFDAFLPIVFPPDALTYALEMFGSHMVVDRWDQKMIWFVGPGGNGKGSVLHVLTGLIGDDNCFPITFETLSNNIFATSGIQGKLVIYDADVELSILRKTATLKRITGGDKMRMEKKGQDAIQIKPHAKLIVAVNGDLKSEDVSEGMLSRYKIVPFERSIRGTSMERNQDELVEAIVAEGSGILNQILPALQALYQRKSYLTVPSIEARTLGYRRRAHPLTAFLDDWTVLDPEAYTPIPEFRAAFDRWRDQYFGEKQSPDDIFMWVKTQPGLKKGRERRATDNGGSEGIWGLRLNAPPPEEE